ncbi:MAG: hypothetical protein KF836_03035 [Fimbriimonadaceae bacterium]|nr:hypothetical protein [Fimbriimonadaceae bacterium]
MIHRILCLLCLITLVACSKTKAPTAKSSDGVSMSIRVKGAAIEFSIRNNSSSPRYIYTSYASLVAEVPSDEPDYYKRKIITDDGREVDQVIPQPTSLIRIAAGSTCNITKGFRYCKPVSGETITARLGPVNPRWFEDKFPEFLKDHKDHLLSGEVIAPAIICP